MFSVTLWHYETVEADRLAGVLDAVGFARPTVVPKAFEQGTSDPQAYCKLEFYDEALEWQAAVLGHARSWCQDSGTHRSRLLRFLVHLHTTVGMKVLESTFRLGGGSALDQLVGQAYARFELSVIE